MRLFIYILLFSVPSILFAQKKPGFSVNFDFDRYDILPGSAARLDSFINTLRAVSAEYTIELYGHCDSIGNYEYNDTLSQKRIRAVKNYLAERNIPASAVLKEEGYGKRRPLNDNSTGNGRFLNRRVDIIVAVNESAPPMAEKETVPEKPKETSITKDIQDTSTKIGSVITLQNLHFYGGRHFILPISMPVLDELLGIMKRNPGLEISIEGHICCLPGDQDGVDNDLGTRNLSEMRAKTVYDHLVRSGISAKRLAYKGFGHRFPLAAYPEKTQSEMTLNRRVEIRIIKK